MNIMKASNQWADRPEDERYWSIEDMLADSRRYSSESVEANVGYKDLVVSPKGEDLVLVGAQGNEARMTNYCFGQLCQRVKAPASYLSTLTPELAANNLNHGLQKVRAADRGMLLLHSNGGLLARCITGLVYSRVWNWEIGQKLLALKDYGWKVPPARPPSNYHGETRQATEADVLVGGKNGMGLSVRVGDIIAPAGVYASDRDMFVFMVDDNHVIENKLSPEAPLARGFFIWNSEVGDKSIGWMRFLYDAVCGNHIVWGAQDVQEVRIRHVGAAGDKAFSKMRIELAKYADCSVNDDQAIIEKAQSYEIAGSKEDVLEELLSFARKKKINVLNQKNLTQAYEIAEETPRYGNPRTAWAISQGLTQVSQESEYTSKRVEMDRAAGKLLEIAF